MSRRGTLLLLEAFYDGSHRQLIDLLLQYFEGSRLIFLSGKKWHWRMRCGALNLAMKLEGDQGVFSSSAPFDALFCSANFNLAEFLSLTTGKLNLKIGGRKILYFHENQLVYPVRDRKDRDYQFGYNQILSALVADVVLFNSNYCMRTFLDMNSFLKFIPDLSRVERKEIHAKILAKSSVLNFPIQFPSIPCELGSELGGSNSIPNRTEGVLRLCWPHRWEHDKNPELFFTTLMKLKKEHAAKFELVVLGQSYGEVPPIFEEAKLVLAEEIIHWGFAESKAQYYELLRNCDVAVSTANHEFFGVAMLEASFCGNFPICPNRLAYPEIFPRECLYNTDQQLLKTLRNFCQRPESARTKRKNMIIDFQKYSWDCLKLDFEYHLFDLKS